MSKGAAILACCYLLLASPGACAIEVTLAMPEDPVGFTGDVL